MKKNMRFMQDCLQFIGMALLSLVLSHCSKDDGPNSFAPSLFIEEATSVTRTTAILSGTIETNGAKIGEYGFLYSTSKSDLPNGENAQKKIVSTTGDVTVTLENLKPGTKYFFCLYAKSGETMIKSNEILDFTTTNLGAPELNPIEQIGEAGEYSFTVRCSIKDFAGTTNMKQFGFSYKKINEINWKISPMENFDNNSDRQFTLEIDGLEPGTKYDVFAIAQNNSVTEIGHSDTLRIETAPLAAPVMTTQNIDPANIGANWVTATGIIENHGASDEILIRGFCWSTTNKKPTIADTKQEVNSDKDQFSATITSLKPTTTYYLRAFASSKVGGQTLYGYGSAITFTTFSFQMPKVSDVEASDVTSTTAKLSSSVTDSGNGNIIEKGFCWSRFSNKPSIETDNVLKSTDTGNSFKATLSGLEESNLYWVRAYVKSEANGETKIGYSEKESYFSTISFIRPTFSSLDATDITRTGAKLSVIIDPGNGTITEKGFCWMKGYDTPTTANSKKAISGNSFEVSLTGLTPETQYSYRAYAICKMGSKEETIYSNDYYPRSFTTLSTTLPTLARIDISKISNSSATLYTSISSTGDGTITERGFCWSSTTAEPSLATGKNEGNAKMEDGKDFTYTIQNLSPGKTYNVRAYLKVNIDNETSVVYSSKGSFTTNSLKAPSLNLEYPAEIGLHSAKLSATVTDYGDGDAITERGFCWSTTLSDPQIESGKNDGTTKIADGADFAYTMSKLTAGKAYYVRAYAKTTVDNTVLVGYSSNRSFNTESYRGADIATPEASTITQNSFSVSCKLNNTGNSDVTEVGFCWSTDKNQKPANMTNKSKVDLSENNTFNKDMKEGLKAGATYYVYAYAVNLAGTTYSYYCATITLKSIPGTDDNETPDKI